MTETPEPLARPSRPRRRWIAFLLNLLLSPTGYVYAGFTRVAFIYVGLSLLAGGGLLAWTLLEPPGVYGLAPASKMLVRVLELGLVVNAVIGLHAAYLAGRPTRSRLRGGVLWLTAFAFWLTPVLISQVLRALGPLAFYTVPSVAMLPTLRQDDVIAMQGSRALCGLQSVRLGDVVIHKSPAKPGIRWVKRVVAGPGSTVEMRNGVLTVDGRAVRQAPEGTMQVATFPGFPPQTARIVRETLIDGASYRTLDLYAGGQDDTTSPVKLGPNEWYVLGDNRDNSLDSRSTGPVAQRDICGVVFKILLSNEPRAEGRRP